jgi:hypothetical protein
LVAALLVPVAFAVSGIGAWLAHHWRWTRTVIGLIALPWVYLTFFIGCMLISFGKAQSFG